MDARNLKYFKQLMNEYRQKLQNRGRYSGDAGMYLDELIEWVEDNEHSFVDDCMPSELVDAYVEMLSFYEEDTYRDQLINDIDSFMYSKEDEEELAQIPDDEE